ncbi:MAG: hypothetical protein WED83_01400 [Acidimicrobiia bacterium]
MSPGPPRSTDLVFNSLGTIVQVRSQEPTLGELIRNLFRHFPPSGQSPDLVISITHDQGRYRIEKNEEGIADGCSRDKALVQLLSIVNETSVYGATSLVVHAGAVASDGEVIAFPASAQAGKSTLVAACLKEGFDYVTDEALLITDTGRVIPYPKAMWLTRESRAALSVDEARLMAPLDDRYKSPVLPEELGAQVAGTPLKMKHLVLPERNGAPVSLEPLGPAFAATELLTHAFNRYDRPREWFELAAGLTRTMSAWRLRYGEASEAASYLRSRLTKSPAS